MSQATRFPILDTLASYERRRGVEGVRAIESVPWELVEPLRARCLRVHDQTLERLAKRGGLGLQELWAHLNAPEPFQGIVWMQLARAAPPIEELRTWIRTLGGLP